MRRAHALVRFGRRVAQLRRQRGWTQEQLAERLHVGNPDYVSRIERGLQNLTLTSTHKLASALGVSLVVLFERPPRAPHSK